jgi:hypothetical protein
MTMRIELLSCGTVVDRFTPPPPPSGSHWREIVWTPDPDPHAVPWPSWLAVRVTFEDEPQAVPSGE